MTPGAGRVCTTSDAAFGRPETAPAPTLDRCDPSSCSRQRLLAAPPGGALTGSFALAGCDAGSLSPDPRPRPRPLRADLRCRPSTGSA